MDDLEREELIESVKKAIDVTIGPSIEDLRRELRNLEERVAYLERDKPEPIKSNTHRSL